MNELKNYSLPAIGIITARAPFNSWSTTILVNSVSTTNIAASVGLRLFREMKGSRAVIIRNKNVVKKNVFLQPIAGKAIGKAINV
jgi:hypothetical protein